MDNKTIFLLMIAALNELTRDDIVIICSHRGLNVDYWWRLYVTEDSYKFMQTMDAEFKDVLLDHMIKKITLEI